MMQLAACKLQIVKTGRRRRVLGGALPACPNPQSRVPPGCRNPQSARRALTLIELLMVIVILTIIVAVAIPIMTPTTSERNLREAARGLNTFITGAQSRAVGRNRPQGIALRRVSLQTGRSNPLDPTNQNGVVTEVYYVEQPPPYSGYDGASKARFALGTTAPDVLIQFVRAASPDVTPQASDTLPPGFDADNFPPGLVRPGDIVEIAGKRFELLVNVLVDPQTGYFSPPSGAITIPANFTARLINDSGQLIRPEHDNLGQRLADPPIVGPLTGPFWTQPAPYRILRQPVPTADEPFQLPPDTVVDLRASGIGNEGSAGSFFHWPGLIDNPYDVMVMFAPEGRVSRVYYHTAPSGASGLEGPVADNVYLLVGPNVPAVPVNEDGSLDGRWGAAANDAERQAMRAPINWLRGESQWVVIGARTGRVVTVQNTFIDPAMILGTFGAMPLEDKRAAQILAARDATRAMSQVGGR